MKLYTEEEIKRTFGFGLSDFDFKGYMNAIKPIELPSDEEIENEASDFGKKYRATTYEKSAYVIGAKYVIDKITGGNK